MAEHVTLQTECFPSATYQAYWDGLLSEDNILAVESHLSECSHCSNILRELESASKSNDLVGPLREMARHSMAPASNPDDQQAPLQTPPGIYQPRMIGSIQSIGPYRLMESLGHGGMGSVFLAEHTMLHKQVAIKLVHFPEHNIDAKSRFEREVLAVGKLQHPSIVAATDAGREGELQYLVMEHVRGLDLSRMCRRVACFTIADVCEIGRQAAIALSYAHSQGFVHRDIKPSNMMLDESGMVKLLDFGLVMFDRWDSAVSELTTVGQFLGTLDYIAPEQAERSGAVDHRADLYGLGASMFRLLCGRGPLAAMPNLSPLEKIRLLANHQPPLLEVLRPDAPAELCQLINGLLQTNPQHRPPSAAHVAQSLEPLCKDANLSALISTAQAVDDEVEKRARPQPLTPSLSMDASKLSPSETPAIEQLRPNAAAKRFGRTWSWIATACLPLSFFAGILIQWETNEGQLVIESELPDAEIKIKRNEDGSEKSLKIETGNTVTKLRGGQYTLELASPSDGISLENGAFNLMRGQTIIARVRLKLPKDQEASNSPTNATLANTASREPLYKGKNLAELLRLTRLEQYQPTWKEGAEGVISILGSHAEQHLFDEIYGIIRKKDMSLLSQWNDERVIDRLFEELKASTTSSRYELMQTVGSLFLIARLTKVAAWIETLHASNDPTAANLFQAFFRFDVREDTHGNRTTTFPPNLVGLDRFLGLESICPELAYRYDELAVEHLSANSSYKTDAAVRILSNEKSSFGACVSAVIYLVNANKPSETKTLIEKSISRLLPRLSSELDSERKYTSGGVLHDLPGGRSPAIALVELCVRKDLKFDRILFQNLTSLRADAEQAWSTYEVLRGKRVYETIGMFWSKNYKPVLTTYGSQNFPKDVRVDELLQKTKSLAIVFFAFGYYAKRDTSELHPKIFFEWIELIEQWDSNGNLLIDETELDESTKQRLTQSFGTIRPTYPLDLNKFLTGRFGLPIQRTAQSYLDPKMIAWMESRMKKFDKDSNKGLDRGEFKTYDMNGNFEAIDQNKDGLADVYELVFARMKQ